MDQLNPQAKSEINDTLNHALRLDDALDEVYTTASSAWTEEEHARQEEDDTLGWCIAFALALVVFVTGTFICRWFVLR